MMNATMWEVKKTGRIGLSYEGYSALQALFVAAGCDAVKAMSLVCCVAIGDEELTYKACGGDLNLIVDHARRCGKV